LLRAVLGQQVAETDGPDQIQPHTCT
jgi:hypothetical protein